MPDKVNITKTKLDNLANAVAAKSGEPVLLTVDQMTDAVLGINLGEENILEGVKVNNVELPIIDKKVNIPAATVTNNGSNITTGVITQNLWNYIDGNFADLWNDISYINNAGYITEETDPTVPAWAKQSTKPSYTAAEVGALPDTTVISDEKLKTESINNNNGTYYLIFGTNNTATSSTKNIDTNLQYIKSSSDDKLEIGSRSMSAPKKGLITLSNGTTTGTTITPGARNQFTTITLPESTGTLALTSDIPTVPENVSDLTNDSGYLTEETDPTVPSWAKASTKPSYNFSEIGSTPTTISGYGITDAYTKTQVDGLVAGVLHYKGTKAAVSNLPASGNTTGDTWHVTADGSEWAWDGMTWQELGTAVDLSDYVTTDDSRLSDARTPTAHNQALSTITGADDLKAIEALSGTSGLLKKTAANTWSLDTNTYMQTSHAANDITSNDITNWNNKLSSYTETDPVFTASAAANISSTDISNWNSKTSNTGTVTSIGLSNATNGGLTVSNSPVTGSGNITVGHSNVLSSAQTTQAVYPIKIDKNGHISAYGSAVTITDEKVKQTPLNGMNSGKGLLFSNSIGSNETTNTVYTSSKITWNDYSPSLSIYNSDRSKYNSLTYSSLSLGNYSTNYLGLLKTANVTANRTYELPDKDGTIALTSDIPQVYSSNNTSGYLTIATLPIYDGTVV